LRDVEKETRADFVGEKN